MRREYRLPTRAELERIVSDKFVVRRIRAEVRVRNEASNQEEEMSGRLSHSTSKRS